MIHRIGICSDTHAHFAPVFDPASVSALLHAGDFYDETADPEALEEDPLQTWLEGCALPAFAVRGNHDYADPRGHFLRWKDITASVRRIASGLFVAGVGFAPQRYYDLPGRAELQPICEQVLDRARRLLGSSDRLVLLTHYPAKLPGLPEEWQHFHCVRELIRELGPIAVVAGHVHQCFGESRKIKLAGRPLLVVHPGPVGGILEIDTSTGAASFLAAGN